MSVIAEKPTIIGSVGNAFSNKHLQALAAENIFKPPIKWREGNKSYNKQCICQTRQITKGIQWQQVNAKNILRGDSVDFIFLSDTYNTIPQQMQKRVATQVIFIRGQAYLDQH